MGQLAPVGSISSLNNKIALITGASSGLGRAIAEAYAGAGAYVVSADLKPEPPQQPNIAQNLQGTDLTTPTVDLLNAEWPSEKAGWQRAEYVQCDVTTEESVKAAVAFTVEKYGRLDIMVNNAGMFPVESRAPGCFDACVFSSDPRDTLARFHRNKF